MGRKDSWSGIAGFCIVLIFWLAGVVGTVGILVGVVIAVMLFCYSGTLYNETPKQIKNNRTRKEKYELTKHCKTADEVHDVLFYDLVVKAAKGYARKKRLKYPDASCYCFAIRSYTQAFYSYSQSCFPEILKKNGCTMVYYKPIIRETYACGIKCTHNIGKIFSLAVSDKGIYKLNIPNEINYFTIRKYGLEHLLEEAATTKVSDIRWTIENQRG